MRHQKARNDICHLGPAIYHLEGRCYHGLHVKAACRRTIHVGQSAPRTTSTKTSARVIRFNSRKNQTVSNRGNTNLFARCLSFSRLSSWPAMFSQRAHSHNGFQLVDKNGNIRKPAGYLDHYQVPGMDGADYSEQITVK